MKHIPAALAATLFVSVALAQSVGPSPAPISTVNIANVTGAGTAAQQAIGTSGATVPLNNTNNQHSGFETFAAGFATITNTYQKQSAAPTTAPGAGNVIVFAVAGTNSGTCKLQVMAGTSTTAVTIIDNVGAGC